MVSRETTVGFKPVLLARNLARNFDIYEYVLVRIAVLHLISETSQWTTHNHKHYNNRKQMAQW